MTTLSLVLAEIRFRLLNVVLGVLTIAAAAALFVAGPTLLSGYARDSHDRLATLRQQNDAQLAALQQQSDAQLAELQQQNDAKLAELDKQTVRIMRDIGVNLRILHKDTNMGGLYTDYVAPDFPEDYVARLAKSKTVETVVHLVATLQQKTKWNGRTILLAGIKPTATDAQVVEGKAHMMPQVDPGMVLVGSELGQDLKPGDTIDIDGHTLKVKRVQPESGTEADVTLMTNLADAQQILGLEGRINMITALSCKCKGDRISAIRRELEQELPDTKVVEISNLATAREMQRDLVAKQASEQRALLEAKAAEQRKLVQAKAAEQRQLLEANRERTEATMAALVNFATPLVIVVSALFVGLLTWLNVRERRPEIGLLRALGKGTGGITGLFLGKALLLGLLGGALGAAVGFGVAIAAGVSLEIPTALFRADPLILIGTIVGAPLIAAIASYLPTYAALNQDPAVVLMDN